MSSDGWIGVDLDGTLAEYESTPAEKWNPFKIGKPIPKMVERIKRWLAEGREVRIVTARVALPSSPIHLREEAFTAQQIARGIQDWLEANLLPRLRVQAHKDYQMVELWDDRAIQVDKNTGEATVERVNREFSQWLCDGGR